MNQSERDIRRKLRILEHAEQIGDVSKTYQYYCIPRGSFYRWRATLQRHGEPAWQTVSPRRETPLTGCPRKSSRRFYICGGLTTWAPSGSSGIWRAITISKSRMPASIAGRRQVPDLSGKKRQSDQALPVHRH